MSTRILVAYATRYGSTQEVADVVAATLREHGLEVEVQHMPKVTSLEGYHVVVMGAPLYIGHWHKDAQKFLMRFKKELVLRPVAFFTLGPTDDAAESWEGVRDQLDELWIKYSWLKPVASELFGGVYDPEKLRFPDSLLAKLPVSPLRSMPPSDVRDWNAIRAWAGRLAARFEAAPNRA